MGRKILYRRINDFLDNLFGFRIVKGNIAPREFKRGYNRYLARVKKNKGPFSYVSKAFRYDVGRHPEGYIDFECSYAANNIANLIPETILDVGSYRHFVIGLLSSYEVTTIDVRERSTELKNETVITCDSKNIPESNNTFDMVLSLCAIEHFGLGRYSDEFDLYADKNAFEEMKRILKSGGHLVFTTAITKGRSFIGFNAHRVYSYDMIRSFCSSMELINEEFYSHDLNCFCPYEQLTERRNEYDIYCGCFRK